MNTDPVADLLTRIRNATKAHHEKTAIPYSKIKENILKVLKEKKFIKDCKVNKEGKQKVKVLEITLDEKLKNITLKRISSPGQRIYIKKNDLKTIKRGTGIKIISTSKGIMSNVEAKKQNLGGEVLCEIY